MPPEGPRPMRLAELFGRWRRRVARAYVLRCAREDARVRNIVVPVGVWACDLCPHVSLDALSFRNHLAGMHA